MRAGLKIPMIALLAALVPAAASAQGGAPFFRGKTVRILLSAGVAGGYAEYGHLLATHMSNHIAGKPDFIVQSMPGAGGLLATNYLFSQAPQDGTTIGLIHSSVPLAPLFGTQGARFDPLKFHWLGSMDRSDGPCTAWHTSPAKTWDDLHRTQFIVGSSGVGSQMDIYPAMLNKLFGTRIKVIGGYKDGASIFYAMEREEIHGRCGPQLTAIKSLRPQWLTEHKISRRSWCRRRAARISRMRRASWNLPRTSRPASSFACSCSRRSLTVRCWRRPASRPSACANCAMPSARP